MKAGTAKTIFGASLLAMALAAHAETYTVKIYGVPAGYTAARANGAGDNALMAGAGVNAQGFEEAIFLTEQGLKKLHPAGWESSTIRDTWGVYHVGFGTRELGLPHALFWVGGGPAADLHPGSPAVASWANGVGGQLQVGAVRGTNDLTTACSWSRTASSNKRLSAPDYQNTEAWGTNGVIIVGKGVDPLTTDTHALMWRNFASPAENLSPAGYFDSAALSVDGNQQAGYVSGPSTSSARHAALWYGSAVSFVDLNPNGVFSESQVNRVRNGLQVGSGIPVNTPSRTQAIAWHGTAARWINLHSRLPGAFIFWNSVANDIDDQGNIIGTVTNANGSISRPVVWLRQ